MKPNLSYRALYLILILLLIGFYFYSHTKEPKADQLRAEIDYLKKSSYITDASVFVREFSAGESYGYQENKKYQPQSMFKVIDLIGISQEAAINPGILKETRTYNPFFGQGVHYEPKKLEFGMYSVATLTEQLITQSDDAALHALFDKERSDRVYADFGFPLFKDGQPYYISPKDATKLFTYLYRELPSPSSGFETYAIHLLSRTTFTQGIVAGVSAGTKVAHKFGENAILDAKGNVKGYGLNDCGIVYTARPYTICIMTLGKDFPGLEKAIKGISELVYYQMTAKND